MPGTKPKVICGLSFDITQPYEAGHVLTEAEAKVLNQTRSENIGNNMRAEVKEAVEKGDTSALAALVADYDSKYVFTLANASASRKLDPVEREARAIAKDLIKDKLAATGRKLTVAPEGYTDETWADYIDGKLDEIAANPAVVAEAQKRVKAKSKFAVGDTIEV